MRWTLLRQYHCGACGADWGKIQGTPKHGKPSIMCSCGQVLERVERTQMVAEHCLYVWKEEKL